MAGNDDGEEKVFWPTPRRLQQLRREGQVPHSRDFISSFGLIFAVVFLATYWKGIFGRLQAALLSVNLQSSRPFADELARLWSALFRIGLEIIIPTFSVVMAGILLGAMLDSRGFPLNIKALAPNFGALSPGQGIKRIFALRNLVELVKGLILIAAIISANYLLFRHFLNTVLWSPTSGVAGVVGSAFAVLGSSVAIGVLILILMTLADLPMSRFLFMRDNRMSHTDLKRENREEMGDPQIRRMRRGQAEMQAQAAGFTGLDRANFLFVGGPAAVAVSYKHGTTAAPIIAARTRDQAQAFLQRAIEKGLIIVEDAELVGKFFDGGSAVGEYIPSATFQPVARLLLQHGFIE